MSAITHPRALASSTITHLRALASSVVTHFRALALSAITRLRALAATPQAQSWRARGAAGYERFVTRRYSLYGAAVLRIGYGLLYFVYLLHEMPNVQRLWGPGAPWTPAIDRALARDAGWPGWIQSWYTLLASDSRLYVDLCYAAALVVCVLFALGWRTRLLAICFMLVVTAFQGRSVLVTDGGDNVQVLMSIYLAMTACGERLSLDSRRARRRAASPARRTFLSLPALPTPSFSFLGADDERLRRSLVTVLHNCAVVLIGYEMCVIYMAAAMFKIQGSMWQDGTALYYALHINWFAPWPALSGFVAGHAVIVAISSYVTVFVQLAVPCAVLSPKLKYPVLATLVGMHLSIMLLMGLPVFSLSMLIGDAIFLPDSFWPGVARSLRGLRRFAAGGALTAASAPTAEGVLPEDGEVRPAEEAADDDAVLA